MQIKKGDSMKKRMLPLLVFSVCMNFGGSQKVAAADITKTTIGLTATGFGTVGLIHYYKELKKLQKQEQDIQKREKINCLIKLTASAIVTAAGLAVATWGFLDSEQVSKMPVEQVQEIAGKSMEEFHALPDSLKRRFSNAVSVELADLDNLETYNKCMQGVQALTTEDIQERVQSETRKGFFSRFRKRKPKVVVDRGESPELEKVENEARLED